MDFGAHLPLIDFDGSGYSLGALTSYADAARDLGYAALAVNDHMLFARPWLDGPTALAAVLPVSGDMQLMTSIGLPVIRGPVQTAKMLGAIDVLSGGRLIAALGPGSSRADYEAVDIEFEERWARLDDAIRCIRAIWRQGEHVGRFYLSKGVSVEPRPAQSGGPPVWIGSWGSDAGLRRVARLADGWLASAYNTTPDDFAAARDRLGDQLRSAGKDPSTFPNGLATMWTFVTEDRPLARKISEDLASMLNRGVDDLSGKLTIGPAEECAAKLRAYESAGSQRVLIWPLRDATRQLEVFMTRVAPFVAD